MPPLPDDYGSPQAIRVYESSNVVPSIWLNVQQSWGPDRDPVSDPPIEATVHMAVETARKLRDQINWLLANHYQGDAR
jgi:hypothetical protein